MGRSGAKIKGNRRSHRLSEERGTIIKKWTGRIPVALLYPNYYPIGVSSLGFQLVYSILNSFEHVVCERFFLPEREEPLRSFETGRILTDFPLLFYSVSFEHDYVNLARMLLDSAAPLFSADRIDGTVSSSSPLVIGGGVATFMNPEPLAPFTDLFLLGEAEELLPSLFVLLDKYLDNKRRSELLLCLQQELLGAYVPELYRPVYDSGGLQTGVDSPADVPARVSRVFVRKNTVAAHSELLSPQAEFSDLYVTELGRGCSRGCRFCAAGFIYRPPRLWNADAVVRGLDARDKQVARIGLLGMEMADDDELNSISSYLLDSGCSLSFSSLRADRISGELLQLLSQSGLKSVAIAPDGASERMRQVINKNLSEHEILQAVDRLAEAGLYKIKLYFMIGLPGERHEDLQELVTLVKKVKERILARGRKRGRLCEIMLSVNSFVPKPWTPFQFHGFGGLEPGRDNAYDGKEAVRSLNEKLRYLKGEIKKISNVRIRSDKPENVLFQAILARGDRRMATVLADIARYKTPWKRAMIDNQLHIGYFAMQNYGKDDFLPWYIVDHNIDTAYLWQEYRRSFQAKTTLPCDTDVCRRCGVCGG